MKTVFGLYNSVLTSLSFADFLGISFFDSWFFSVTLSGLIFGSPSFLPSLIVLVISICDILCLRTSLARSWSSFFLFSGRPLTTIFFAFF